MPRSKRKFHSVETISNLQTRKSKRLVQKSSRGQRNHMILSSLYGNLDISIKDRKKSKTLENSFNEQSTKEDVNSIQLDENGMMGIPVMAVCQLILDYAEPYHYQLTWWGEHYFLSTIKLPWQIKCICRLMKLNLDLKWWNYTQICNAVMESWNEISNENENVNEIVRTRLTNTICKYLDQCIEMGFMNVM